MYSLETLESLHTYTGRLHQQVARASTPRLRTRKVVRRAPGVTGVTSGRFGR